jgi:hypothetical protein
MFETPVLMLVAQYPNASALARRAGSAPFPMLQRLEGDGLVTRREGGYRLTRRGRDELELRSALGRSIARAFR